MSMFAGCDCPYCNEKIKENDLLAVCPECGTPHHRDCWLAHDHCANRHMHASGYVWTRPLREEDVIPDIACPACGRLNNPNNIFCNYCSADLRGEREVLSERYREGVADDKLTTATGGLFGELTLSGRFSTEIDGIPFDDWKTYIGSNQYYYLYHMDRQSKGGSQVSFTLGAALFPVLYFIYRRLWKQAALAFAANLLLALPVLAELLSAAYGNILGVPAATWSVLSTVATVLRFGVQLCWGLFAVAVFRKTGVRRMSALRAQSGSEAAFQSALKKSGGPSLTALICAVGACAALWLFSAALTGGLF